MSASEPLSKSNTDVLILTTPTGHRSIAHAIQDTVRAAGYTSEIVLHEERSAFFVYQQFYRRFPDKFESVYDLVNSRFGRRAGYWQLVMKNSGFVLDAVERTQPKLIVSTALSFNPVLDTHADQLPPFINIMPNPRTYFHLDIAAHALMNFAFDETTRAAAHAQKPVAPIQASGWFVREAFEADYEQAAVRDSLGLPTDQPIALLTSGSEGARQLATVSRELVTLAEATPHRPLTLIAIAGSNSGLETQLRELAATTPDHLTLEVRGFVDDMHRYMQAADLVVGKAGPNSIFESVATLTPFFAITHIGGLEDGNLGLLDEYNIGMVNEDPSAAATEISQLIHTPAELKNLQQPLEKLRHFNRTAKDDFLDLAAPHLS